MNVKDSSSSSSSSSSPFSFLLTTSLNFTFHPIQPSISTPLAISKLFIGVYGNSSIFIRSLLLARQSSVVAGINFDKKRQKYLCDIFLEGKNGFCLFNEEMKPNWEYEFAEWILSEVFKAEEVVLLQSLSHVKVPLTEKDCRTRLILSPSHPLSLTPSPPPLNFLSIFGVSADFLIFCSFKGIPCGVGLGIDLEYEFNGGDVVNFWKFGKLWQEIERRGEEEEKRVEEEAKKEIKRLNKGKFNNIYL